MRGLSGTLLDHYGHLVREPLFVEQVSAREINSRNYLVRCGSRSDAPRFVLKEEVVGDGESLQTRMRKISLYDRLTPALSLLPALLRTEEGRPWVLSQGLLYTLFVFCPGEPYEEDVSSGADAARGLAKLHCLLRQCDESFESPADYDELTASGVGGVTSRLEASRPLSAFMAKVEALARGGLQAYYDEFHSVTAGRDLPSALVHYDFHRGNAVFRERRLAAILDLDSIATTYRMQSVAFACSRFAGAEGAWHFLGAYHEIDPLTCDEIRSYPLFVRREAVNRLNWIVRMNVLKGQCLWREDLEKHLASIEQARALDATFNQPDAKLHDRMQKALADLGPEAGTEGTGERRTEDGPCPQLTDRCA